tara:strand:+ start:49 stop:240 length:192 start_codon:yes stop_codon:yes gene_type:complete
MNVNEKNLIPDLFDNERFFSTNKIGKNAIKIKKNIFGTIHETTKNTDEDIDKIKFLIYLKIYN